VAVELSVEDLLPWPEIERTARNGNNDLTTHHLSLQVRVPVVLACPVVAIGADRLMRRQFLEPLLVIRVQTALVVVESVCRTTIPCGNYSSVIPFVSPAMPPVPECILVDKLCRHHAIV
jgi:hypothetical protein